MQLVDPGAYEELAATLGPERCCSLHARHVIATGHGRIFVDRWPDPRGGVAFTGGNMGCFGDPRAVPPAAIEAIVRPLLGEWERVFIDPGESFGAPLEAELEDLWLWPRVIFSLDGPLIDPAESVGVEIRPIEPSDARALANLDESIEWIWDTHDGPEALAASGRAAGAWRDDRLLAVAAVFYRGEQYEELGVVTESDARGLGLSPLCSAALIRAIGARGRTACWSTTPDNAASMRVARKLGFRHVADQRHYMLGKPVTGAIEIPRDIAKR